MNARPRLDPQADGGGAPRGSMPEDPRLLAVIEELERTSPSAAAVVRLRHFRGLSLEDAARALGLDVSVAQAHWRFGRAFIHRQLETPMDRED